MSACPDCTKAAEIWHWGGTRVGCRSCEIRDLATMPKKRRDEALEAAAAKDLEAARALRREVRAEFDRIQALKTGIAPKGLAT
ncbi:MAG: hypothetical protein ACK4PH_05925 [Aquincola tertiaricarbonis]